MRPSPQRLLAVLASALLAAGCGKSASSQSPFGAAGASAPPGALALATKNTTRLGGADAASDAAAVARAVFPGLTPTTRPQTVVLVDEHDWTGALAASALASAPLGAPLLYTRGRLLPEASVQALRAMRPLGAPALQGAQVISVASGVALPAGLRVRAVSRGGDLAHLAARIAGLLASAAGHPSRQAIVLTEGEAPALQMPAAALAALSGAPILYVTPGGIPLATASVLRRGHHPAIYVPGASLASPRVLAALGRLGRVVRLAGGEAGEAGGRPPSAAESRNPVANAISVSRFSDGGFGWGIHEAGHGLVFARTSRPFDAPAAAPLASHGDYGPLLLLSRGVSMPAQLARYLSNIEPGYTPSVSPVRAVYNHGWLIGDASAVSLLAQAEIDAILEVAPRTQGAGETSVAPPE